MGLFSYTALTNVATNILNRRTPTETVDLLKDLNENFANFIKSQQMFGDTLEHVQVAMSEKKAYNPTQVISGYYAEQLLNKCYNQTKVSKTYHASKMPQEIRKAMTNAQSMAQLIQSIENRNFQSHKYDMYYNFVSLMEDDALIPYIDVEDFSTFATDSYDVRKDKIEKFIQKVLDTRIDMQFYSNRYISVDSGLSAEQQGRMIATASSDSLILYINRTYASWVDVDLTKRFNTEGVNLEKRIVDFKDSNKVAYLVHTNRYANVPFIVEADAEKQFATGGRIDFALTVQEMFANIHLFPAVVFTIDGTLTANPQPLDKGTRYETLAETA